MIRMGSREPAFTFPRVQALPEIDGVSLRLDGVTHLSYRIPGDRPRPYFFPLLGPSGATLTRLGHPGDPVGHGHHLSIWFAHEKIDSVNFWADRPGTDVRIRHRQVRGFQDGANWAAFAVEMDWWADGRSRLSHFLIATIEPMEEGFAVDLQSRFTSPTGAPVLLGQTNFGFLGVRVASSMTEQFGGGKLSSSEGATGEDAIFGKAARWVDYAGPSAPDVVEGISYFDHPANPHHPTLWHVRRDGWMCASFNQASSYGVAADHPLDLRYRLYVHSGPADHSRIERAWQAFAQTPPYSFLPRGASGFPEIQRA